MYHINKEITGNGENLTLQNTAKHYFKKFDILGNSKQETREGYNVLPITLKSQTQKGVTITVKKDGSITLNGTSTEGFSITFSQTSIVLNGDYIFYLFGKSSRINFQGYENGNAVAYLKFSDTNQSVTKKFSTDTTITNLFCYINANTVFNNETFKFMITKGTEEKPYEQYGATPSIEFESPIESVGDNINYLPTDESDWEQGGVSSSNGENTNNTARLRTKDFIDIPNNQCYVSMQNTNYAFVNILMYDKSGTFINAYGNIDYSLVGSKSLAVTFPSECKKIKVVVNKANDSTITPSEILTIKPKLEKGTKATPYSPYGEGSIEIYNCNENFLQNEGVSKTINGVAFTVNKDGTVIANGTATDNVSLYVFAEGSPVRRKPLNIKNGDYILSGCPAGGGSSTYRLGMIYSEGSNNYVYIVDNGSGISFNYDGKNVGVYCEVRKGYTANNLIFKPMIRLATDTDDTFRAHQSQTKALYTQQPFRAIGDVKDRFVKQNGVWHEEHNYSRYIFTGNESDVSLRGTYNNLNVFQILEPFNYKLETSEVGNAKSNYFECQKTISYVGSGTIIEGLQLYHNIGNTSRAVYINTNEFTTVEELQEWLKTQYNAGTPLYVDYILEELLLIPCTQEQAEQLESIEKETYSYDEVTHIHSTDEISPYFEVTAYQRISEEFKTRLKEGKITRGYLKVLATDTLPEIIINENNYLKEFKIEELRYVPEEGFIGGAVAKRVTGNFNNVDNSFDIQDREVEVYLGVELEDETTEYIKYGTYIVQRPEDDQVNDNTSFEALDYMVKFNQEYKDRITYPCTLKQLLDDIVDQAGVNSKIATFANSEFVVENNQFEQGTTLRGVLKAITQMAFNWSRIDADDNLVMDFEIKEDIDEELGTDDYFGFKKTDDYGPVNVIVLRNSQVEGENVTIKDEELINEPKGYNLINAKYDVDIFANDPYRIKVEPNTYYLLTLKQICIALGTSTRSQHWYKIFDKDGNILKQTNIIPFDFTEVNEIKSGKQALLMPENADYITIDLGSYNSSASNTLRHLEVQFVKGKEEKPYQPFVPTGEIELVIADNPFAYTELKRKQLIEAGRRLFGLRYTPMAVDMLGLMYLNAKDRISVENLNGEKFNTYLLDHTIDYTGIVLDSMQSQAKTKTETKYQYISPLAQGLSQVEIKVDKANKRIESIVKTQEDVSEKVANTISKVEVVYALSDSATVAPTSGWSTTAPEWVAGKYMWQKTITTYANGTTAETAATNITGAKGEAGQNGVGIIQTNITYQKSTSGTTVPTGTWQTTIPEVNEDGYLWTRTEFIYSDGSKKYAYNVGKKGATGIGVKSLVDQYYLSTSNTTQTGGSWKETQDAWNEKGYYMWTRTKITWTDGSITYTDPILANTLNSINSEVIVLQEFKSSQVSTNTSIKNSVEETKKTLANDYLTAEQTNSKIDGLDDKYEILDKRVAKTELTAGQFKVQIDKINNQGVDKITTSVGYTFNDSGLNINRTGADTATLVNEKGVEVLDKTGTSSTPLLYAGYVEEGNDNFPDYEGQTIVAASNLIVQNYLIVGSNSRFQNYNNPTLGGQGTGAFDI